VRQHAEAPGLEHLPRAGDERLVALRERDGDERALLRRLLGDGLHFPGA